MTDRLVIFAGGGTGGHLVPALAVAEALARVAPGVRVVFACSDRDIDRRILSAAPYAVVVQPVRPLPRGPRGWWAFGRRWLASWRLARRLVGDLRPAAVLGLGGFAAAPVVRSAAGAGVPTALMSIDAVPGLANRHLARRADVIFAQFASTAERYGRNASKVRVVGCPVRTGLGEADAGEARRHFGLRDDRRTLLVVAGSLGAANINRAVGAIRSDLDGLSDAWQVLHVTGPGKLDAVQEAWRDASIAHVATEFCEHMELAYAAGDLALCRSGAATVAELAAAGLPAVFMPYPYHRDQQQRHNAAERVGSGAAVMASDAGDPAANAAALRETMLPILRQPARLEAMRRAAAGAGSGRAAEEIARWLAGQGAGPP